MPCGKGHVFEFKEYRTKELPTVLGLMKLERAYYYDHECLCERTILYELSIKNLVSNCCVCFGLSKEFVLPNKIEGLFFVS